MIPLLALVLMAGPEQPARTQGDDIALASLDAAKQNPDAARFARYQSAYHTADESELVAYGKALSFWVNSLSRNAEVVKPRAVGPTLWAIDLREYGIDPEVYDKLADVDPFFHRKLVVGPGEVEYPGGWLAGEFFGPGKYQFKEKYFAKPVGVFKGKNQIALSKLTHSNAPILFLPWFIQQTSQQEGRAVGYYDIQGLRNLADLEALAGLDRKAAQRVQKEVASLVVESGVTLQNRQLYRFGTIAGAWWESRDVSDPTGRGNAVQNLDAEFLPEAFEVIFSRPNGLQGYGLLNDKGELQKTAPDRIASDKLSPSNDRRVHVGISCVRCHKEDGLRPFDDYGRKLFAKDGPLPLDSPVFETFQRLRRLHLKPYNRLIAADRAIYAAALEECNGLTGEENAKLFAWVVEDYDAPVGSERAAAMLGVPADRLRAVLLANARKGFFPPVVAGLLLKPEQPMRREHFEEFFATLDLMLAGAMQ